MVSSQFYFTRNSSRVHLSVGGFGVIIFGVCISWGKQRYGDCINWGRQICVILNVSIEVHMWWMYQLRYTCGECINNIYVRSIWWMYPLGYKCGECINWGTHVVNVSIEVHMWWMYQLRYTCGECINLCKKYLVNVSLGVQMWWMCQLGYTYLVKVSFEVKNSCCESINWGKTKLLLVIWIFPFGWDWMWPWLTNSLKSTSLSFIHTTFEHNIIDLLQDEIDYTNLVKAIETL